MRGGEQAEIDLVVWERGSGITLACGTGACATVVAACLEERLAPGAETPVHLPGGTLAITVAQGLLRRRMRGPARTVFSGSSIDARVSAAERASRSRTACPARCGAAGGGKPRCS